MKELVDKIQSIPGVSVHIPDDGIISIGNGSGFNPRIDVKNINSVDKLKSSEGEAVVELNFFDGRYLRITSKDFIFSLQQSGMVKVSNFTDA